MTPKDVIAQAEKEAGKMFEEIDEYCTTHAIEPMSDKFKSFLSSYTKDLLQSDREEIRRKWNELSDLRDGTQKGDGEFIDAFDDYLLNNL